MVLEYYREAREIAATLAAEGHEDWARQLNDAIDGGATSGEIIMALRWHLRELLRKKVPMTPATKKRVKQFRRSLWWVW